MNTIILVRELQPLKEYAQNRQNARYTDKLLQKACEKMANRIYRLFEWNEFSEIIGFCSKGIHNVKSNVDFLLRFA